LTLGLINNPLTREIHWENSLVTTLWPGRIQGCADPAGTLQQSIINPKQ